MESTIASTIAATVLKPVMYLPAPSETPRMTGLFISSQAVRTASVSYTHLDVYKRQGLED